jgi:1,4-alpha-glucan branching enzyme
MKNKILFIAFSLIFASACTQTSPVETETKETNEENISYMNDQGLVYPAWTKASNIYEVNIRQYTPEGTFAAFEPHMERLKEMGVDILWFMPINPIGEKNRKGSMGSYYAVKDYTAVNPEFGTMEEFKALVEKAHEMGMHVIIDWVANHTAWDNVWVDEHPDWYVKDEEGNYNSPYDWTDVIELDYENHDTWKGMTEALKFWLIEAKIDGFRCDVAMEVTTAFWDSARVELEKVNPEVFMLAEAETAEHHIRAFNANYGWEMFHTMKAVAKGEKNVNDIWAQKAKEDTLFTSDVYQMLFTSNHDENSWNGTDKESFGDAMRTFAVASWVMKGIPLIYSGQEAGLDKRLSFFEKDSINWENLYAEEFYTELAQMKNNNPALWNGAYGGEMIKIENSAAKQILSFSRTKDNNTVLVMINLSADSLDVEFQMGTEFIGNYTNALSDESVEVQENQSLHFAPWQYYVLRK